MREGAFTLSKLFPLYDGNFSKSRSSETAHTARPDGPGRAGQKGLGEAEFWSHASPSCSTKGSDLDIRHSIA